MICSEQTCGYEDNKMIIPGRLAYISTLFSKLAIHANKPY